MKMALVLGLVLVGLLEIPLAGDLKIKELVIEGEVKGEEVILQKFFEPVVKNIASPLTPPSPRPNLTLTSTPKPNNISKTLAEINLPIIKEIVLLSEEKKLKDEVLEISFPELGDNKNWYLELELELVSVEDTLGFDTPGFTIHIDDYLAYQQSVFEDEIKKIAFNLATFSSAPQTLSIWSGNNGDELKDTSAIIKKIRLIFKDKHDFIETEAINNLIVTVDSEEYATLEWDAPQTNDANLGKPLAYDIRYLSEPITLENWFQAQSIEIFLPQFFSPHSSGFREIILIKAPQIVFGYLAIRSIDSAGALSPLGESIPYKAKD